MAKDSSQDRIDQLNERVEYLESILRQQSARLYAIEENIGMPRLPAVIPQPEERPPAEAIKPEQAATRPAPRADLEARIGGSWFNRIGILAICFGVAFFLKYAFEKGLIGPTGRVALGIFTGICFLALGERMRPRYQSYAYGLSGGGILILYISIYAANAFFDPPLIPQVPAFILMAGITAAAAMLAARYHALPIAMLGLVGGFLTPPLLSTGQDNQVALFGYVALLNAGVLALAYSKQWRSLNYMAFGATVATFAAWLLFRYESEKLWTTLFFLTLMFAVFALLAVAYNVINRRPTTWLDLLLVFLNAVFYFGASYALLEYRYQPYLGIFAILVAAFYFSLGVLTYGRDRDDRLLIYTFYGLALLFVVLAVPIQLDLRWVTMGWAIEGAVLTWIGLRLGDRASLYGAMTVFIVAALYWLAADAPAVGDGSPLLTSYSTFSCAVLVGMLALSARLINRQPEKLEERERHIFTGAYVLGANALVIILLSLEAGDYFEQGLTRQLSLSLIWAAYGGVMLTVGIVTRSASLRFMALALLGLTTLKVFLIDLAQLENYRIVSFIALGAILLAVSFLYQRYRQRAAAEDRENAEVRAGSD
jgi:uncharacterized membrane protein